jgi:carbon storage regulator CsrA
MLVLTRKTDQVVRIGNVRVMIVRVDRQTGQVRLGIDAPPEVEIVRGELESGGAANSGARD